MGVRGMGEASEWARAFASAAAALRVEKGLTIQELASRIGKDPSYVSGRLNFNAPFNMNDWELLASALEVHPLELARRAAQMQPHSDDFEPMADLDRSELSRRLKLLEKTPRSTGEPFYGAVLASLAAERAIAFTEDDWIRLRDGSGDGKVPLRVLELVAEYSGVDVGYLAELSNSDVADAAEAQLELRDAIRAVGGDGVLARSVGDVSPAGLRAIAASLRAAGGDGKDVG